MDLLALPTDGFSPDGLRYRIWDSTMMVDRVVIDIDLGDNGWMPRDQVDQVIRPHMQAMYAALLAASPYPGGVQLLVEYRGSRVDDLTPPAAGPLESGA